MKLISAQDYTLISSNIAPSALADWNSATAYAIGNKVLYTDHREYEAISANTNKIPSDNNSTWKLLGTENKYKMFDQFIGSQTVGSEVIDVICSSYGFEAIYLGNLIGDSVIFKVISNTTQEVIETQEFSLFLPIGDWQQYFFGNIFKTKKRSQIIERISTEFDVSFQVEVYHETPKIGQLFIGKKEDLGGTRWQPSVSLVDYSKIATNTDTGETYLQQGASAKQNDYLVFVPTNLTDLVYNTLDDNRGMPCVFYHGFGYDILTSYGFITKVEILLNTPTESILTLNTKGLI